MPNTSDGSVTIAVDLDSTNFQSGLSRLGGQLNGIKATLVKVGAVVGAAFSIKALVSFGKEAIDLGSNIAEVQNVVDTAFGSMAYKAEEFADTAIQQFGMSKLAAKKTASTYMAMARGMGMSADRASDMAVSLAGLTGDVASFFNISQELADVKLKSVFTGETESLKDLGIVMTQTNLDAFALANGFGKTIDKMTQAEQVELRYQYVTKQLALAQGDFAKTSDSWANQTRILSENWKEFMSVIGQALITVLTPALRVINSIVASLVQMANVINKAVSSLFGGASEQIGATATAAEATEKAIEGSASGASDLAKSTEKAGKAAKGALASFDELNILSTQSSSSSTSGSAAGGSAIATPGLSTEKTEQGAGRLAEIFQKIGDDFRKFVVQPILNGLHLFDGPIASFKALFSDIGEQCREWLAPLSDWFQNDFQGNVSESVLTVETVLAGLMEIFAQVGNTLWVAMKPVIDWLVTDGLPLFSSMWSEVCKNVTTTFDSVKEIVLTVWNGVFDPFYRFVSRVVVDLLTTFKKLWDEYGAPTFENIRTFITNVKESILNLWEKVLQPIWNDAMEAADELWTQHLQPLVQKVGEFVASFINAAMTFYNNVILPVVDWIVNVFGPPIAKTIGSIIDKFKTGAAGIITAVKDTISVMKSILDFLTNIFKGDWEAAWKSVKEILDGILTGMENVVKSGMNNIISFINGMLQALESGINAVSGAVNSLTGKLGFTIPELNIPKIPKLAQGAVIPPNREFMAVLGDQKQGTNIEAPLETIKQALAEVMAQYGNRGTDQEAVMEVDGVQFAKLIFRLNKSEQRRIGVSLTEV